jgi:tetratricopeptide (TPR) repeat protein
MTRQVYIYLLLIILWPMQSQALAQEKYLDVFVTNTNKSAVSSISITCTGGCSTELISQGRARIALPSRTRPNDTIVLRLVRRSPRNPEWIIISPPDGVVIIPSFGSQTGNVASVPVVVRLKGDKKVLSRGEIRNIVETTLKKAQSLDGQLSEREFDLALRMQAKAYGMTTEEVTLAIREWAAKATDPYEKGIAALLDKKYNEATRSLTTSYDLRKKGAEGFADVAFFLGHSLRYQGKYSEAVEKLKEALVFRKNEPAILLTLGLSLTDAGKYSEAEEIYRRDLPLVEQEFGKRSAEMGVLLNNLALACRLQGKVAEGENLYNESLAILKEKVGADDPLTANPLNNLGQLYRDQGMYVKAEARYKEALAIREKKLGRDHLDTAVTIDNLGQLYTALGRYGEAEPLLKEALDAKVKTLGYEHPLTANSYGGLGSLYIAQSKYAEAVQMFEKELAVREKQTDHENPHKADVLNSIGVANHRQGKFAEAERSYNQAIDICQKTSLTNCSMTFRNLAKLYTTQGKYTEAEPLFKRSLAIYESSLLGREPSARIVFVLESYAELLRKTNREEEANAIESRAKEIRAKAKFYDKN